MDEVATTYLDSRQFEQALAILERERPSPSDERRFRLLNQVVWSAVFLTLGWFFLLPSNPAVARWLLIAAVFFYVVSVAMVAANVGLGRKLVRAAMLRRSLRLWPRLRPSFKARRRRHAVQNLVTLVLTLVGYPIFLFGVFGLLIELLDSRDSAGLPLAVVQTVFGLGCISIHFIARGKERLEVISELRSDLVARRSTAGTRVEVSEDKYEQIASIERAQIARDRRRSLARPAKDTQGYVLRLHRSLREAEAQLEPEVLMQVRECARQLLVDPAGNPGGSPSEWSYAEVPGAGYELAFTVDHARREVHVMELRPLAKRPESSR
jgi:hypothetical protein